MIYIPSVFFFIWEGSFLLFSFSLFINSLVDWYDTLAKTSNTPVMCFAFLYFCVRSDELPGLQ